MESRSIRRDAINVIKPNRVLNDEVATTSSAARALPPGSTSLGAFWLLRVCDRLLQFSICSS
jgi:hypothetical protein